ncbi:MAG: hypothetical protein EOO38_04465 [Cytophagaceae bacterium]|nr:MAG: hypothetical protein EOO38_04465 [Cytophagaceae bacterium]
MHSLGKTRFVTSGTAVTSAATILALGIVGVVALPALLSHRMAIAQVPASSAPLVALSGTDSRIVKPSFKRITSDKEWANLWQQHTGKTASEYYDQSHMPRVNFDNCMVIAIFSGSSLSNDGVSALSVTEQPEKVVLRYSNRYLQIEMPDAKTKKKAAINGAFGMFVLPRSTKPVVLEEAFITRKGKPPVPEVRAELPAS